MNYVKIYINLGDSIMLLLLPEIYVKKNIYIRMQMFVSVNAWRIFEWLTALWVTPMFDNE